MSQLYETRLKKEFELLQKLDRHPDVKDIISIYYQERVGVKTYKSIAETPNGLYPNSFKVTYTMPMYVGAGKIKKDWSASFAFNVPESILMNPMSNLGVSIVGNNGNFKPGEVPFNNHCSTGFVCTGSAWEVANQGFGIWYFVIHKIQHQRFLCFNVGKSNYRSTNFLIFHYLYCFNKLVCKCIHRFNN